MMASTAEAVLFWCLAPLMVVAAVGLLFVKRAVHAAVCVVAIMISMAVLYIANQAPFLGVVQVVVYTGAVMMLFLFVLMLVGVDSSDSLVETIKGQRWLSIIFGLGLLAVLLGVLAHTDLPAAVGLDSNQPNPNLLADILYGKYVLAMVVVGVLLVTAALAGLVLTHRARLVPRVGQREMSQQRVAGFETAPLTPQPAPGVYAQNNAMDTPALGPDGQPLLESVPRVLRIRGQERDAAAIAAGQDSTRLLAGGRGAEAPVPTAAGQPSSPTLFAELAQDDLAAPEIEEAPDANN